GLFQKDHSYKKITHTTSALESSESTCEPFRDGLRDFEVCGVARRWSDRACVPILIANCVGDVLLCDGRAWKSRVKVWAAGRPHPDQPVKCASELARSDSAP